MARRIVAFLLGVLLLTGILPQIAAAANAPAKKPAVGGQLNLALASDPDNLNPLFSATVYSDSILSLVYAHLFEYNEKWEPVPDLAESWKPSADGLVWTIQIRKGVLFHDGSELTADDVAFTFQTVMNPDYKGPRKSDVASLKAVTAPEKYTVKVELKEPMANIYSALDTGILSKKQFAGVFLRDMANDAPSWNPVGAGPYKFVEYKRGDYVLLERNPNWYRSKELGGAPFITNIRFKIINDWTRQFEAFTSGNIDLLTLEPNEVTDKVKAVAVPIEYDRNGWGYLTLNTTKPHLSDKRVRQALTYALDRPYINRMLMGKAATVPAGPISPLSWAYDSALKPLPHDAVKAMDLLEEAGYARNAQGYYEKGGKVLQLTLGFADSPKARALATYTTLYWALIGVKADPKFMDFNTLLASASAGGVDVMYSGFSLALDPDLSALFHSSQIGTFNRMQYKNPEVDKLLDAGRKELNQAKRKEIYVQVQRKIMDDAPLILLYSDHYTDWVSKRVKGGVVNFPGYGVAHMELWWLNEQ